MPKLAPSADTLHITIMSTRYRYTAAPNIFYPLYYKLEFENGSLFCVVMLCKPTIVLDNYLTQQFKPVTFICLCLQLNALDFENIMENPFIY